MASQTALVSNCSCSHLSARRPLRAQSVPSCSRPSLASSFTPQTISSSCSNLSGTSLRIHSSSARPSQRPQRQVTCMAAKVTGMIKLALQAGKANPAPPVGPALGSKGVNIMAFCKAYNAATQEKIGTVIPVEITVYDDRSFTFVLKTPPASVLLKKAAKVESGSGQPNSVKVGSVTRDQLREIATTKLPDLNTTNVDMAMNIVEGTAKNMGITISG